MAEISLTSLQCDMELFLRFSSNFFSMSAILDLMCLEKEASLDGIEKASCFVALEISDTAYRYHLHLEIINQTRND